MTKHFFTSESVSQGHPDKTCDIISDSLLDFCITKDKFARCAFETFATTNNIIIGGETRIGGYELTNQDVETVVRKTLHKIGHDYDGFAYDKVKITNLIQPQSSDISIGVDEAEHKDEGAGDQGIMFGFACNETDVFMPASIYYANLILKNIKEAGYVDLGPDAKSQITGIYENGKFVGIDSVVVSIQHLPSISLAEVKQKIMPILEKTLPQMPTQNKIYINPTGIFTIGGPVADTGLTGRKIIVDTYGGAAQHGGGAFSGKDPTKVDRSGAYITRYIAKNLVAAGIANRCTIQISYAIGISEPLSVFVDCHGTGKFSDEKIIEFIKQNISLTPKNIRNHLQLNRPIYEKTASFGHFGREYNEQTGEFSWEKLDLVDKIKDWFEN